MRKKTIFSFVILLTIISSCGTRNETITRSFYYWRSNFTLGADGRKMLSELHVSKIYLKFFDVDVFEDEPFPKSTLHVLDSVPSGIEIIPVVFITNATLKSLAGEYALEELAGKIIRKVKGIQNCFTTINKFKEIQFDCDWSEETRDRYFYLLKQIQEKFEEPITLSATIRLHQIKYFERTGVPPVTRGTLMFYNMGKIEDMNGGNSIFNEKDASSYLVNFDKYPLPLDVALPVFSWAIAFREGKIFGLINEVDEDLRKNDALKLVKDNLFEVQKTIRYDDVLLMPGDNVKFEETGPEEASSAAKLIRPHLAQDSVTVTLFDYDYKNLSKYKISSIEKIYSYFD
ncbi:hypothetical protein BH09BAC3_BH09BAC3_37040 [soil metagenome]